MVFEGFSNVHPLSQLGLDSKYREGILWENDSKEERERVCVCVYNILHLFQMIETNDISEEKIKMKQTMEGNEFHCHAPVESIYSA